MSASTVRKWYTKALYTGKRINRKLIVEHFVECCQAKSNLIDSQINILETMLRELSNEAHFKTDHIQKLKKDQ